MKRKTDRLLPYLYSTPFFVLLLIFMLLPFIMNIGISFTNYSLTRTGVKFVGLKNYFDLLGDYHTTDAIARSFVFVVGILVFTMLLGMFYAVLMSLDIRGGGVLKAIVLLPWIIPESVTGYVWKWLMTKDSGLLYYLMLKTGLISDGTSFFFDPRLAMALVIWVNVWRTAPFIAIMTYAKLKALPTSHVEAAQLDGANAVQVFTHITLPWLRPILERCMILLFVWSFNSYSIIFIMTNGGPAAGTTTLPFLIRQKAFANYNFGQATALAVLSLLIIILSWALIKLLIAAVHALKRRQYSHA